MVKEFIIKECSNKKDQDGYLLLYRYVEVTDEYTHKNVEKGGGHLLFTEKTKIIIFVMSK